MNPRSTSNRRRDDPDQRPVRQRILDAAFLAFMESGYAEASTLEIATRAHVSKRELYACFGSKQDMLVACLGERAKRLEAPAGLPVPHDRETLAQALTAFGTQLLREISDPAVIAMFRLAIAEATRAPEVARALDAIGSETSRTALKQILTRARSAGLVGGQPAEMAEQFIGLLWGHLMQRLLLGVTERPNAREIARRAQDAAAGLLRLYPSPDRTATG